jgi:transcriptional regulator with XRE-family HTH domain
VILMTKLRTERGWSQSRLAREANLNQATVNAGERGRLILYPSQLKKLAAALGVPEDEAQSLMEVSC